MRLEWLVLQNINSLAGTWEVDWTRPEVAGEGVLLISGPTGAGKTTVLDALTLALYGRTPRMGRVTATNNEVMTRGEAEMRAELAFATAKGRYLASFTQRRARGKAQGRLQAPSHELVDLDSGAVLAEGLRETERAVTEVLGLGFEQFTRAVLLAQNGFAAFLLAAADERAPLLERITGTEIYSQLSIAAHERAKEERARLDAWTERLAALELMPAQEVAEATQRLAALERQAKSTAEHLEELRALQARWRDFQALQEEAASLKEAESQVLQQLRALEDDRKTAAVARRAEEAARDVAEVERLEKETREAEAACQRLAREVQSLVAESRSLGASVEAARAETAKARSAWETMRPRLAEARRWDAEIAAAVATQRQAQNLVSREKARLEAETQRVARCQREQAALEARLQTLGVLRKNETDVDLGAVVQAALTAWAAEEEAVARELAAAQEELQRSQEELAVVKEMESLEAKRRQLRPGSPCPLCGSLDHPFAHGAPLAQPIAEAVVRHKEHCRQCAHKLEALRARRHALGETWAAMAHHAAALQAAVQAEAAARRALAEAQAALAQATQAMERCREQRRTVLPDSDVEAVETRLRTQAERSAARQEALQRQHAACTARLAASQAREQEWARRVQELAQSLASAKERLAARLQELGFASLGVWRSARRDAAWMAQVEAAAKDAEARLAAIQLGRQRVALRRQAVRAHLEGAPPHAEVEAAVTEHEAKLQEIQEERGAVAARVAEARRREAQARAMQQAQAAQAAVAATWERLRELMGSADGKKLRNFAQGLTLDLLLSVANARLAAMSDRYQLVRDGAGLDIAVIDGYRAGERRSVRNLSGGETFVVSLALALALSSLVSGGGELGCLFVDEGFGTLDEESLELVLESLFALGEENRLVGIISHVPALRERLLCQIAVRPMTPGRSSLWVRTPQGWASLAAGNGG
ncbi:MAG TPA: hypothetical protein DEU72_06240 [Desulfomicrobiaceae bacterium]|jgi:exonuclease SbcC|nr:hypothetical protein [Desulfomicrobiaceae bacterium]